MDCPGCDVTLRPLLADTDTIVQCPRCRGLWLDTDAANEKRSTDSSATALLAGLAEADDRPFPNLSDLLMRLLDRAAEFQSILDHASAEIVLKDTEARYVLINRRTEQLYGRSNQQVRGKLAQDIFSEIPAQRLHESAMTALASATTQTTEVDDDEGRTFLGTQFPVRDWRGNVTGLGGIAIDITERRRAQLALEKLNSELESRVAERTRELHQAHDELLQKERLVTIGQVTGTVSHELRNPLSVIRTSLFVIERYPEAAAPQMRKAMQRVRRNLARCDRIVEELLDYARTGNAGLHAQAHETVVLDDWLAEVVKDTVPAGTVVGTGFGAPGITVPLCKERMRRAIINVINNALEAMAAANAGDSQPPASISIVTHAAADSVAIEIEDAGPGIAPDVLPRIFEPLFSTKGFGAGLGLAVVKDTCERHGGGVDVDLQAGRETRICMWNQRGSAAGK